MSDFLRSSIGKGILAGAGLAATYVVPKIYSSIAARMSGETMSKVVKTTKTALAAGIENGRSGNLVAATQAARVEPILMIDPRAMNIDFVDDSIHSLVSLFTAYYLQAIALETNIGGVRLINRLDKFNPDRDLAEATKSFFGLESYSPESYQYGLPMPNQPIGLEAYGINPSNVPSVSFENKGARIPMSPQEYEDALERAMQDAEVRRIVDSKINSPDARRTRAIEENDIRRTLDSMNAGDRMSRAEQDAEVRRRIDEKYNSPEHRLEVARQDATIRQMIEKEFTERSMSVGVKDAAKVISEITNMAVGKVLEVTISEDGKEAKIPVTIRCRTTSMPSDAMVETLAVGGMDISARSRWRKFRAKELSFWSDIILATDRIDAHRRALTKDKSGYYKAVYDRANNNMKAELMGGGPSVGTSSSIFLITEQTRRELEEKIGAPLSDFQTRQGIFINTFSILLAVIDPDWEELTIYHRGIEMPTKLKASLLKTANKGSGPDVAEILKAYQLGNAPRSL